MSKVFRTFRELKPNVERVVCLGNFDGIHRGHQKILSRCLEIAAKSQMEALFFGFYPHPRKFLTKSSEPRLLLNRSEKLELLEVFGFQNILLQDFDEDFSKLEAAEFINDVLIDSLGTKTLVVGKEFRFGYQAEGRLEDLKKSSFLVLEQDEVIFNQQKISSSTIRRDVSNGDISRANEALGYSYFISGKVVQGEGRGGSQLGFPTINIDFEKECIPAEGVYVGMLQDLQSGNNFPAVINFGRRPSFQADRLSLEAHLIHTEDNFYDRAVRLFFFKRLRAEMKFNNISELKSQIQFDVESAASLLSSMNFLQLPAPTMKWSLASPPDAAQAFKAFDFSRV